MQDQKLGFIGLGVMGEPMCRNLAAKSRHAGLDAPSIAREIERWLKEEPRPIPEPLAPVGSA